MRDTTDDGRTGTFGRSTRVDRVTGECKRRTRRSETGKLCIFVRVVKAPCVLSPEYEAVGFPRDCVPQSGVRQGRGSRSGKQVRRTELEVLSRIDSSIWWITSSLLTALHASPWAP